MPIFLPSLVITMSHESYAEQLKITHYLDSIQKGEESFYELRRDSNFNYFTKYIATTESASKILHFEEFSGGGIYRMYSLIRPFHNPRVMKLPLS